MDYLIWNEIPTVVGNLVGGLAFTGLTLYATHVRTAPKRVAAHRADRRTGALRHDLTLTRRASTVPWVRPRSLVVNMPRELKISVGQYSDKGRKETNQDFHGVLIPDEPLLSLKGIAIVLADGISSSNVSRVAS